MSRLLRDTVRRAHEAGLCVVPPREDGSKAPLGAWKQYQTTRPDEAQLTEWYGPSQGIGLVCGQVSGGLECLELEATATTDGIQHQLRELADHAGAGELLTRVLAGYSVRSPSGGIHLYYLCDEVAPNTKLARRPHPDTGEIQVLIETRGEGGYVITAPTGGPVHPSIASWQKITGQIDTITRITPDERQELHDICRSLDQMPSQGVRAVASIEEAKDRPGDAYNTAPDAQARILALLEEAGWAQVYVRGDAVYLRRPGKTTGVSATLGHVAPGVLYVHTTSTAFDAPGAFSPFRVYAILKHDSDWTAAARALREEGHGADTTRSQRAVDDKTPDYNGDHTTASSWRPVDLTSVLAGEEPELRPTILHRTDGVALLYPGALNAIYGEPESGKSWLALFAAAEQLIRGHPVIYIDLEDTPSRLVGRLQALGVHDNELGKLAYISPQEPYDAPTVKEVYEEVRPSLVVFDAVAEAASLDGADPMSNTDMAAWIPRPRHVHAVTPEACILLIDHVRKNRHERGRWAIGAQHKLAAIDGCALIAETITPFAPGQPGETRLRVAKDRLGGLAAYSTGQGRLIAHAHIGDTDSDEMSITIKPPSGGWRPTVLMERISNHLAFYPGATQRNILTAVTGKRDHLRTALSLLVEEGYVAVTQREGQGGGWAHTSVKPFRETEETETR